MNTFRLIAGLLVWVMLAGAGCAAQTSEGTASLTPGVREAEDAAPTEQEGAAETGNVEPAEESRLVVVNSWGATLRIPASWTVAVEGGDTLRTTTITGTDGWYVRIDENVEWTGMPDARTSVADMESRLAKKYADFATQGASDITIDDTRMVRWDFSHTGADGIHLAKVDVFFQPSADHAPCAMVLGYPSSEGAAASELAERIIASLDVTP